MRQSTFTRINFLLIIFFLLTFISFKLYAQPGSLDHSFDKDGVVATVCPIHFYPGQYGTKSNGANTAALQADGKILVAASFHLDFSNDSAILMRYNPNGSIDSSFGTNGLIKFTGANGIITSIAVEPNDKILISYKEGENPINSHLYCFFSDGTKDTSFHPDIPTFSFYYTEILDIKLQPDGKIIAAGQADFINFYVRYASNGNLDSSFGNNGIVETEQTDKQNYADYITAISLQANGRIVAAGQSSQSSNSYFYVTRYLNNGRLDSSFGTDGNIHTAFDNNSYNTANCILIQDNGSIVAGGYTGAAYLDASSDFALARYLPDGTKDAGFGKNGLVQTDFYGNADIVNSITTDQNGKLIVAGYTTKADGSTDIALARYSVIGSLDSMFGNNGKVVTDVGENSWGKKIISQPDNKVIVAGGIYNTYADTIEPYIILTRYVTDNTLALSLTNFNAVKEEMSVLLKWQCVAEMNVSYFSVETSKNGTQFSQIATIKSKNNNGPVQSYTYEDAHPFDGNNFYRIKQTGVNGEVSYSQTLLVDFENSLIHLYPDPVKDVLNIEGLNPATVNNLFIIGLNGEVIKTATAKENHYTWNVQSLAKGFYYLRIEAGSKINIMKLVKE